MQKTFLSIFYKTNFKYIFFALISYLFVNGVNSYFFHDNLLGRESLLNCFLFGVAFIILFFSSLYMTKRSFFCFSAFSFILSFAMFFGFPIYTYGSSDTFFFPITNLVKNIAFIIAFTLVFTSFFSVGEHLITKLKIPVNRTPWKIYKYPVALCLILFICWLPCYLAYYPGVFAYDMYAQHPEAMGLVPLSKYHPPLHTLYWRLCLWLEDITPLNALEFYSVSQMLILAFAFTQLLKFFIQKKFNNYVILFCLLFFAFNPVIAIFSFIPTKDAMYTAFCVLFVVELCRFLFDDSTSSRKWDIVRFTLVGVLCCLFRNNMIYAMVPSAVVMLFVTASKRKATLFRFALVIVCFFLINYPFFDILGIENGNKRELLSVPIQQISYVVNYHYDEISPEDYQAICKYLPFEEIPELYNLRLADPIKNTFNTTYFEEDSATFFWVWGRLLLQYPKEYIVAFLNLNLPYWYPDACSIDAHAQRIYIETYIYDESASGYAIQRDSKIPWLYNKYETVASYQLFMSRPLLATVFSISTPIWVLLLYVTICVYNKKYILIAPAILMIGIWLTFLLGPVSNFRYMFPIITLYPLYFGILLQPGLLHDKD